MTYQSKSNSILYLGEQDVIASGLTMKETIDIVEGVYARHATGKMLMPPKRGIDISEIESEWKTGSTAMFGFDGGKGVVGTKWIGENKTNTAQRGLPNCIATILLNDGASFWPKSILQGVWITGMRTGAESVVGMKYLAGSRFLGGAGTLSILGCGVQARFQMQAILSITSLKRIVAYDPIKESLQKFCEEIGNTLKDKGTVVEQAGSPGEAVAQGDVIVTVTSDAGSPFIRFKDLKPGALVCALGARQELSLEAIHSSSKVVVDNRAQILHSGQLSKWVASGTFTERNIYAEICEIIVGKKDGRTSEDEIIIYMPGGMATLDIAVADRVFELARSKGLGIELSY